MVEPGDVANILGDAARLLGAGRLVVFGSAALAMRIPNAPRTRDVDIWTEPPDRGEVLNAFMGELSWYHEKHGAYVEVWGPETFAAPIDWPSRAATLTNEDLPSVTLVVPHPHDLLLAKLERWEPQDVAHADLILAAAPLPERVFDQLLAKAPYRTGAITDPARIHRFEVHAMELRARLPRGFGSY